MKKIQYFKLFESRTAELNKDEFNKILKEKCTNWLANPIYLQRAKNTFDGNYTYINPKLHIREPFKDEISGVSSKHHSLLMDNLPSWEGFCKRAESIIFISKPILTSSFGDYYYYVIPYDNAKFSVAPCMDLWASIADVSSKYESEKYKFDSLFSEYMVDYNISDSSYVDMISDLNKAFDDYKESNNAKKFFRVIFDKMIEDNYSDVGEALSDYFAPDKFSSRSGEKGFKNMAYDEMSKELGDSIAYFNTHKPREVWTDSECLLVFCDKYTNISILVDKFKEMIESLS
jgi:hypothetical protein